MKSKFSMFMEVACVAGIMVAFAAYVNHTLKVEDQRIDRIDQRSAKVYAYTSEVMAEVSAMRESLKPPEAMSAPNPIPRVGDVVSVYFEKAGGAYLTKESSWQVMQDACVMEDDDESDRIIQKLEADGETIIAPNGTKLEVLEGRFWTLKVRVMDGNSTGWEGFIPRKLVRKT